MSGSGMPVRPVQSSDQPAGDASNPGQVQATCWGFAEGAAGMLSQVRGLSQAVGLPSTIRELTLAFPWNKCWPGFIPLRPSIFRDRETLFAGPPPQLVITCARQAVMASLWLKKQHGDRVFTVHIQDPKIDPRKFDLVIAPEHDGLTGPNVFASRGALHHICPEVLSKAVAAGPIGPLAELKQPFVTVLLGGPNSCYSFEPADLRPLIDRLRRMANREGVQLAILPSRRTPELVLKLFQEAFARPHFVWDRTGENPYISALALCSHLIVTGDSVSMLSECAATEKPVYVFSLPERRRSRRFRQFHQSFIDCGISRPFEGELEFWKYKSPNPTQQIAELIRQRLGENHVLPARSAA
ncbi:mitochondrial fission ELM1 family protein [Planctomicrobium sp. SH661]|uniref:mitochondrial fission ELM1 family protein n=1 Tax=Planctomicrobium sp. SH661 TaxID=3448124 RepID=UPI003F5AE91C